MCSESSDRDQLLRAVSTLLSLPDHECTPFASAAIRCVCNKLRIDDQLRVTIIHYLHHTSDHSIGESALRLSCYLRIATNTLSCMPSSDRVLLSSTPKVAEAVWRRLCDHNGKSIQSWDEARVQCLDLRSAVVFPYDWDEHVSHDDIERAKRRYREWILGSVLWCDCAEFVSGVRSLSHNGLRLLNQTGSEWRVVLSGSQLFSEKYCAFAALTEIQRHCCFFR